MGLFVTVREPISLHQAVFFQSYTAAEPSPEEVSTTIPGVSPSQQDQLSPGTAEQVCQYTVTQLSTRVFASRFFFFLFGINAKNVC